MALLHGAVLLRPSPDAGFRLAVAHLNHGLRGESGRRDAELVRSVADRLGLTVVVTECDPGELRARSQGSLEESARNTRYEFLRRTAIALQLPFVATAHHAGDQAETILHHVLRGTGLRGMRGIPERRPLGESVTLIRPMLTISRDTIQHFVTEQQISFSDDGTNADSDFTRNRIRNQLLPSLRKEFNPRVDAGLIRLSQQTGEVLDCLDALADQILDRALLEQTPSVCRLDREVLQQWPEPLIRHALTVLWSRCAWPRQMMTSRHWTQLAGIIIDGNERALDLPGRLRLSCSGRIVRLDRSES